jgi:phospholipid/cholesterol/gamma-HCH transport system substrate-binding protein
VKIASEGLLGGSFVEITPGASEFVLEPGDEFVNVQSSVSLLNLLMRFGTGE